MRITFATADEFLAELSREAEAKHVWQNQVRYRIDAAPEQVEEFTFKVSLTLTALCELEDGGQYILEGTFNCGCDDRDAQPKDKGSKAALEIVKQLRSLSFLKALPGKIEAF